MFQSHEEQKEDKDCDFLERILPTGMEDQQWGSCKF